MSVDEQTSKAVNEILSILDNMNNLKKSLKVISLVLAIVSAAADLRDALIKVEEATSGKKSQI